MLSLTRIFFCISLLVIQDVTAARSQQPLTVTTVDHYDPTDANSSAGAPSGPDKLTSFTGGGPATPNLDYIDHLEGQAKSFTADNQNLRAQLKELTDLQTTMLATTKEFKEKNAALTEKLAASDKLASEAQVAKDAAAAEAAKLQEELAALQEAAKSAPTTKDLEEAKAALIQKETEANQAAEEQQKRIDALIAQQKETAEALAAATVTTNELPELQKRVAALETENEGLKEAADAATKAQKALVVQATAKHLESLALGQQQWETVQASVADALAAPVATFARALDVLNKSVIPGLSKKLSGQRIALEMISKLQAEIERLTAENKLLKTQLAAEKDSDTRQADLDKATTAAAAQLKLATDDASQKATQIAELQEELSQAQEALAESKKMTQRLASSSSSSARQIQVKYATYQQVMERNLAQLFQRLLRTGEALNSLESSIDDARNLQTRIDELARITKTLGDNLKEYLQQVTIALKTSDSGPSDDASQAAIQDLKDKLSSLTQQYSLLQASSTAQLADLSGQLRAFNSGVNSNSEIQRLQDQLRSQQLLDQKLKDAELSAKLELLSSNQAQAAISTRDALSARDAAVSSSLGSMRDTQVRDVVSTRDALSSRDTAVSSSLGSMRDTQVRDVVSTRDALSARDVAASTTTNALRDAQAREANTALATRLTDRSVTDAKLSALHDAQARDANTTLGNRLTDRAITDTKVALVESLAQQANTSAAMATATAISAATKTGSGGPYTFGQQPFSQFMAGMPQAQMPITPQMMSSFPAPTQQVLTNLMQLPQYSTPTSMTQAQKQLEYVVQNYSKYRPFYNQAIQMIIQDTTSPETRNRVESALQQAIKREGYIIYSWGINGSPQSQQQAISLLRQLIDDVERPLIEMQAKLRPQGLTLTPAPEETTALLEGYIGNLTSKSGGAPLMLTA